MFDKYRSLTQFSAFKRQHKPACNTAYLSQHRLFSPRCLSSTAGTNGTHRKAVCLRRVLDLVEVL